MNKTLTRSIGFWLLLALALISAAVGGWLVSDQTGTMTETLLDGSATAVEVYVGQSLIVVGSALLGAGLLGVFVAIALVAVQSIIRTSSPTSTEPTDERAFDGEDEIPVRSAETEIEIESTVVSDESSVVAVTPDDVTAERAEGANADDDDQNGSNGSIATATKISVK